MYVYVTVGKIIHCSWLLMNCWWVVCEETWYIWGLELGLYISTGNMQLVHNFD